MCVEITQVGRYCVVRLTGKRLSESDVSSAIATIHQLLITELKNIVFSVGEFLLGDNVITGLLVMCQEKIRHRGGTVTLIEKSCDGKNGHRDICESLDIPVYCDENEFLQKVGDTSSCYAA